MKGISSAIAVALIAFTSITIIGASYLYTMSDVGTNATTTTTILETTTVTETTTIGTTTTIQETTTTVPDNATTTTTLGTIQENCCNGIDDDDDGYEDGYDIDCQENVNLVAGYNQVCWWTEWNDYGNDRNYTSGWFKCPEEYEATTVAVYSYLDTYELSLADDNDCLISYNKDGEERARVCGKEDPIMSDNPRTGWVKLRFISDSSGVDDGIKIYEINCTLLEIDSDGDGYTADEDCNDTDETINPGAEEICDDGIDNNCDGSIDEGCSCTEGTERECGTDVGECEYGNQTCINSEWGQCEDAVNSTTEICDGLDNDCDGYVDNGVYLTFYGDIDKDGYGNPEIFVATCELPTDYVSDNTDCNDTDETVNPGADEVCDDEIDNDCDGDTDCVDTDCESDPSCITGCTEGQTQPCTKECTHKTCSELTCAQTSEDVSGTQTCIGGEWGECEIECSDECSTDIDCTMYGNGDCEEGETYSSCPQDCCDSDCTALDDSICHSECDGYNDCAFNLLCKRSPSGSYICCDSNEGSAECCEGTCVDCGTERYECCYSDGSSCGRRYVDYYCSEGECYGPDIDTCQDCGPYTCSGGSCTSTCSQTCGAECDSPDDCTSGICNLDTCTCEQTTKPDLVILDIWVLNNTVYYRIKNQGNTGAGSTKSKLYVDGSYMSIDDVDSLSAGTYRNEYFSSYTWDCSDSTDKIKICADYDNTIDEIEEDNNCREKYFSCGSSGGCPILKVFDGKEFVEVEKLDIHAPRGIDTVYSRPVSMKPYEDGKYKIILTEASYLLWEGSHMDNVKLVTDGKECELESVIHSKHGDILDKLIESDDIRTETKPGEEISLTFAGCSGKEFIFIIEGYNPIGGPVKMSLILLNRLMEYISGLIGLRR